METKSTSVFCVLPNFNGGAELVDAVESLLAQSQPCSIICVDNGSDENSFKILQSFGKKIILLRNENNLGFAGGVNVGISYALSEGADAVALFNNDAVADKLWLASMLKLMQTEKDVGIVTCKFLHKRDGTFDTSGDIYSSWLLAFPRGRGEKDDAQYDKREFVFGASGGASLYRAEMLRSIGLFDEDFFAYYEDVDISFRAQLAGWKIVYEPKSVAYHDIGLTSSKLKGFTVYHSVKNVPMIWMKNLPLQLWWRCVPRFWVVYPLMLLSLSKQGNSRYVAKGLGMLLLLTPKKLFQRWGIQHRRTVSANYISSIMYNDLPPDRYKLRRLRARILFWRHYEDRY